MSENTSEESDAVEEYHATEQLPTTIILAVVKIAGTQHYIPLEIRLDFKAGDIIDLCLEPTNPYDSKAVEVRWRGRDAKSSSLKVGYIPKPLAQAIFALIEAEYSIWAEVTEDRNQNITISMHP